MRFFSSALAASLVAVAAGLVINRGVEVEAPVDIQEACRGLMIWHPDGFYRSGTTVRYHGHMWQCTRWNRGVSYIDIYFGPMLTSLLPEGKPRGIGFVARPRSLRPRRDERPDGLWQALRSCRDPR
ncbi:hypothetical protein RSOL_422860 [Rhizoctonia solani AG-3 Rhs1AP]|uniref:Uncharacterized protein n=1 Tax=Rhizoctonia solani AG-3 Rhs1AP TaxID=1086054 RepID=X8JGU9_9AGAM|nr:hypothetical protein RSOL_422860 [Rhizoctonia solani AG-3 Rhs1AP]